MSSIKLEQSNMHSGALEWKCDRQFTRPFFASKHEKCILGIELRRDYIMTWTNEYYISCWGFSHGFLQWIITHLNWEVTFGHLACFLCCLPMGCSCLQVGLFNWCTKHWKYAGNFVLWYFYQNLLIDCNVNLYCSQQHSHAYFCF